MSHLRLAALVLTLTACPIPTDEGKKPDDGAEGATEHAPVEPAPEVPEPETGSSEAGAEALSCEDELAKVKAELAACEAAK